MSNQCSTLSTCRSFSLCTPFLTPLKPYTNTLRPFFPFQHRLILTGRRSRRRASFSLLTVAAQSSSDIVLIATTEHRDGSLVFRFGDASEVVENQNAVEEIESQTEQETSVVKVLDGDQDTQVIIQTNDRGDDSIERRRIEADESETSAIRDLREYHAEPSEKLSEISEKVPLSQSDAKTKNSFEIFENILDETKLSALVNGEESGEGSSDPTIHLLGNSPNIEESADLDEAILKGSDDKPVNPSVSVELEITHVSEIGDVDDLGKVETEDTINIDKEKSFAVPATMPVSDIELIDAANENVEEEMKDMIFDEVTDTDELPASNPLEIQSIDVVNEDVEEELQDMTINDTAIKDETPTFDHLVEPTLREVTQLQSMHVKDETIEEELPQNDAALVMPVSHVEEAERTVEEEVIQPQSIQVDFHIKGPSGSVQLKVMGATQSYAVDESYMMEMKDISGSDTKDLLPPATLNVSDDMNERLQDMNISEGAFTDDMPASDPLGTESVLEVSTAKSIDVKDVGMDERLQDINITGVFFPGDMPASDPIETESIFEDSTAKSMNVKDADMDERFQDMDTTESTFIDEMPKSDPLVAEQTIEVSTTKDMGRDVKDLAVEGDSQLVSEGPVIDEMPKSDPLIAEPTLEVSTTKGMSMDVKDLAVEDNLQLVSEGPLINDMPKSDPLVAEPTLEVSTTKDMGMDAKDLAVEGDLQLVNEVPFIDDMPKSDPSVAESTLEVSTTKGMSVNVKDLAVEDNLQQVSEGPFIDEMPKSDPLVAEPFLEVSTTKGMSVDVMDLAVEDNLQLVSKGPFIDEMPKSDPLVAEPTLEVSATKDMGMDVKDLAVEGDLQLVSEGPFIDEMPKSDSLVDEPSSEVSTTKGMSMDVKDLAVEDNLQLVSEGPFIDEITELNPLVAEPTLEVSTTKGVSMGVKDLAVEDDLQPVSNDNMDVPEIADVMTAEPVLEEEVSQPDSTPVELKATGQNLDDISPVTDEDVGDSYIEVAEQSSLQLESQPVQDEGLNHMLEQHAKPTAVESSTVLKQVAYDPLLEAEITDGMFGSSEHAEESEVTALMSEAETEVEREEVYLTDNFLLSGATLLEHPSKALTGVDDAYFVVGSKWLGVANGVSQWSFDGTDTGVYAQELMRTCEEIVLDSRMTNPVELLCRGVKETNMSGSSSVLIANFNGQALHVANIGDTGFLIIRHGAIYKKSSPLLHEFHFALQVDDSGDPLQLVEEYLVELEVGDIVVTATDGLFDNLYEREITMIVFKSLQAGMKPQEISKILATRAQEVGKPAFVRSPFSDAAQAAGYTGCAGGKPDNVAVIVSVVEKGPNFLAV